MAKKRTRAQKIKAQQNFKPFLNSIKTPEYGLPASNVKGQFEKASNTITASNLIKNSPVITENNLNLKLIKKELLKSLIVSSLILCLIAVIYLLWNKI